MEENGFRAHIKNEQIRIVTEYNSVLLRRINFYYTQALKDKKLNSKDLKSFVSDIKNELPNIEVPKMSKYNYTQMTKERAGEIYAEFEKLDTSPDLKNAIEKVDEVFSMYSHDYKNADKAIEAATAAVETTIQSVQQVAEQETAMNTLIGSADSMEFAGGPGIKKKLEIVDDNTEAFAIAVMTNFIANIAEARKHVRVTAWGKLSITQMGAALAKLAEGKKDKFTGLKFTEVEK
jgi:hypothetical protein